MKFCNSSVVVNKKVSYRKQIARQHSWSTVKKIAPHLVDHHAKF